MPLNSFKTSLFRQWNKSSCHSCSHETLHRNYEDSIRFMNYNQISNKTNTEVCILCTERLRNYKGRGGSMTAARKDSWIPWNEVLVLSFTADSHVPLTFNSHLNRAKDNVTEFQNRWLDKYCNVLCCQAPNSCILYILIRNAN